MYILVQKENGEEDEYASLNGALQPSPMATVFTWEMISYIFVQNSKVEESP